jgi:tol-pal system protein YbgF
MLTFGWKPFLICAVLAAFWVPAQGCVSKESFRAIEEHSHQQEAELARTRTELKKIRKEQDAVRAEQAELRADLIDLHTEIQNLRGQVSLSVHSEDQSARNSEALGESLLLQVSNLQRELHSTQSRVGRVEDYFGLKQTEAVEKPPKPAKAAVAPPSSEKKPKTGTSGAKNENDGKNKPFSPEEAYEAAFRLHKAAQYENARKAFEQFVRMYPQSSLVDNALFWIGETYYRTGEYGQAILQYQKVLDKYPKGSKAPDSLLKMGYALEKIGEQQAAVAALNKLMKEYPKASQAELARKKIQQLIPAKTDGKKDRGNEVEQNPEKAAQENKPPK